jgi:hypothetical protein
VLLLRADSACCCNTCGSFREGEVRFEEGTSKGVYSEVGSFLSEGRREEAQELKEVSVGVLWPEVISVVQPDIRECLSFRGLSCGRGDGGSGSIVLTTFPSASTTS